VVRMRRRVVWSGVLALVLVFAFAGAALAGNFTTPKIKSPRNGAHVHAGRITIKVYDPGVSHDVSPVNVTINPHRKLDKYGHLKSNCSVSKGCEFYGLKKWKHHPGWWILTENVSFPGFWAVTPGTYYMQASHVAPLCQAKGCEVVGRIQKIHIVG
jgi:hypothetical protein